MALPLVDIGTGVETGDGDPLRVAFTHVNAYLIDHETRISANSVTLGGLGTAATRNVGTTTGTVADGAALQAEILRAQGAEQLLAPLASPALTGAPTAPTPPAGNNTTQIATTAFVTNAVAVGGQPVVLYTPQSLNSTQQSAARANIGAAAAGANTDITSLNAPALGAATATTAAVGDGSTKVATTAYVLGQGGSAAPLMDGSAAAGTSTSFARQDHVHPSDTSRAPLVSPAFTGTPTAPTAAGGTNNTQIATTAFVVGAVAGGGVAAVLYTAQSLTTGQQNQARANITAAASGANTDITSLNGPDLGAATATTAAVGTATSQVATTAFVAAARITGAAPSAPSSSVSLASTDFDRPLFPTGTLTITMPNGGAGWRSGTIKNANAITGLITLAVPSGATLDGVANGTTVLYPFQRARIVQTGASAYATDWVDTSPIIAQQIITTAVASADFNLPAGYSHFRLIVSPAVLSATNTNLVATVSDSGVSGLKNGASDYTYERLYGGGTAVTAAVTTGANLFIASSGNGIRVRPVSSFIINPGDANINAAFIGQCGRVDGNGAYTVDQLAGFYTGGTSGQIGRINLMRLAPTTGTFTGNITIYAEP